MEKLNSESQESNKNHWFLLGLHGFPKESHRFPRIFMDFREFH